MIEVVRQKAGILTSERCLQLGWTNPR